MEPIKIEKCEGYLWWSDLQEPKVYCGEKMDQSFDENANPFVVEGQLFDKDNNVSYSIKYIDGEYIVEKFEVQDDDFTNPNNETKTYLSNRMGDRWLSFLRYWEEKNDENCMNMPVLTLTKNVFVGF